MKPRTRRGLAVVGALAALGIASALVLNAFQSNLVFFFSPTQVMANEAPRERNFRIGGLVEQGSLQRETQGLTVRFAVTDLAHTIPVTYTGLLPDLFKEGKGVVAQGKLGADGVFRADQVLAKHDENYMPPEAAEALKNAASHKQQSSETLVADPAPSGTSPYSSRSQTLIYELGHVALILALSMALAQSVLPLIGAQTGKVAWMALARPSARGQFVFLVIAYGCLTHAFVTNDFSVALAARNSNSTLPLVFRITAVWGNHEGSILLWSLILSMWTLAVSIFSRQLDQRHAGPRAGCDGPDQLRLPAVHAVHVEPVRTRVSRTAGWPGSEPAAAGRRHGDPTRPCSTWVMSASWWRSRSRWLPCCRAGSMRHGRAGRAPGPRWPGVS